MRFTDRVVVVTGAGSGIGRVMAGCFAAEGASVADRVADWAEAVVRGGGAIVTIAPVRPRLLGNEAYSAAKAGMINLTQSIAARYGPRGIRANAIAPGSIRMPVWRERVDKDPEVFDTLVERYPLGRIGEPEDVAAAALFLASDDSVWVGGAVLRVDGALMAGYPLMADELLVESRDPDGP